MGNCVPYGFLVENRLDVNQTICGGIARERHLYTTTSSSAEVIILPRQAEDGAFLIQFSGEKTFLVDLLS